MKFTFSKKSTSKHLVIVPVFSKSVTHGESFTALLKDLASKKIFSGNIGESFYDFSKHVLFVGLGNGSKLNPEKILNAFGAAGKSAQTHKAKSVSILLARELENYAEYLATGIILGSYQSGSPYKTGKTKKKLEESLLTNVEIVTSSVQKITKEIERGIAIAQTANDVRDWVNAPPNYANATFYDSKAKSIAKKSGAKLKILKNADLKKLKMGAILGVNKGSPDEARLMVLDYTPRGANAKKPPLVFVGKGILFDSGGYNLKPSGHIEDMQLDKAGASVVLALFQILPLLKINRRIVGIAPFTENLIGKTAMKPSEIITTHSGKTIEVTNTDAEGRLVLSDALSYAVEEYKPEIIVDLATLTGACVIALGDRYAGLFGNDKKLLKKLRQAGAYTNELLWPLPIHKDYAAKMKGHYADLRNSDTGSSREAGASKGAAFLREFVGKTAWAHLDIAGPAFTSNPKKYDHKGATGFGVRLLARFLEMYANRD